MNQQNFQYICDNVYVYIIKIYSTFTKSSMSWKQLLATRSSHRGCPIKEGVFENFAKLRGKQLCRSLLFNKAAGLRPATSLKKKIRHRRSSLNFVKILRKPFLQNTYGQEFATALRKLCKISCDVLKTFGSPYLLSVLTGVFFRH